MNLSRRARLDREAEARGGVRKAPPAVVLPAVVPPVVVELPPVAVELPPEAPPPIPAGPPPKVPRYVRPPAEKRAAVTSTPLPPPTAKPAGKLMSKNLTAGGPVALTGKKGPGVRRGPIADTKPRPFGRG